MTPNQVNAMSERYHYYLRAFEGALALGDRVASICYASLAINQVVHALAPGANQDGLSFIRKMRLPTYPSDVYKGDGNSQSEMEEQDDTYVGSDSGTRR